MTDQSVPTADESQPLRREDIPTQDVNASFDERQPETQGDSPLDAELGEEGQGDILAEDEPRSAGDEDDEPQDLRVSALP